MGCAADLSWVRRIEPDDDSGSGPLLAEVSPDGVVCANDYTAAQLMKTLYRVAPAAGAIQIAAFDDVKYASLLPMPLTTIRQPCEAIGAAAVGAMTQRLRNPRLPARDILLDFTLVAR